MSTCTDSPFGIGKIASPPLHQQVCEQHAVDLYLMSAASLGHPKEAYTARSAPASAAPQSVMSRPKSDYANQFRIRAL